MDVFFGNYVIIFLFGSVHVACDPCNRRFSYHPSLNSCYYFDENVSLSWQEGREICQNYGGDLLVINSPAEEDFVSCYLRREIDRTNTKVNIKRWWIGLHRVNSQWKWVSGDNATIEQLFWHVDEPSLPPDRNVCVEFRQFLLNDVDCSLRRNVICEAEPNNEPVVTPSRPPATVSTTGETTTSGEYKKYIFFAIIGGIALLALIAIIAVVCLAVRVRRLRRTYEANGFHNQVSPQASIVIDSRDLSGRAPQTLPRPEPKPQHRLVLNAHSYAEPELEQHPGYEKLKQYTPRYLELVH